MPVETELRAMAGAPRQVVSSAAADVIAIPVRPGTDGPVAESEGFEDLPVDFGALLAHHEAKGEAGELVGIPVDLGRGLVDVLMFGVGDAAPARMRRAGAVLARRCRARRRLVVVPPASAGYAEILAFAEGALLASYTFRIGASEDMKGPVRDITIVTGDDAPLVRARAVAAAAALARDLTNTPASEKSPGWLAERAAEVAGRGGLAVRVRSERELRERGFGGIVAVGSGSVRPPRLIELTYDPGPAAPGSADPAAGGPGGHVVLVGKGITFDSGGLSLKPNFNMKLMKTDMAGGGVVMAVLGALRDLNVRCKVTGLIAAAENMPSGSAMRPSDVIRHYGGRTSEVLNTDAEGRLVLADALAYADARLSPDTIVDIATLTGASKVALGLRYAAMYATDDALAAALFEAGEVSGERVWRMPLEADYRSSLDSDVADVANVERGAGMGGKSITAALFLREFVGRRSWAHLDIAGPARAEYDTAEITKGATGYGVRLLLRWLTGAR